MLINNTYKKAEIYFELTISLRVNGNELKRIRAVFFSSLEKICIAIVEANSMPMNSKDIPVNVYILIVTNIIIIIFLLIKKSFLINCSKRITPFFRIKHNIF